MGARVSTAREVIPSLCSLRMLVFIKMAFCGSNAANAKGAMALGHFSTHYLHAFPQGPWRVDGKKRWEVELSSGASSGLAALWPLPRKGACVRVGRCPVPWRIGAAFPLHLHPHLHLHPAREAVAREPRQAQRRTCPRPRNTAECGGIRRNTCHQPASPRLAGGRSSSARCRLARSGPGNS